MKVWVLDDKHFPTGYAVGLVDAKYPERRRLHLGERHLDVIGPRPVELLVEPYVEGDTLLGVCAVRRAGRDEMDLTDERIVLQPDENGKFVVAMNTEKMADIVADFAELSKEKQISHHVYEVCDTQKSYTEYIK